jgi:hypothetical protein
MTTSPPAIENFEKLPVLTTGPYDYGVKHKNVDGRCKAVDNGTKVTGYLTINNCDSLA